MFDWINHLPPWNMEAVILFGDPRLPQTFNCWQYLLPRFWSRPCCSSRQQFSQLPRGFGPELSSHWTCQSPIRGICTNNNVTHKSRTSKWLTINIFLRPVFPRLSFCRDLTHTVGLLAGTIYHQLCFCFWWHDLTFLGMTVFAPASEKAPWMPWMEREGYLGR